jgi:predicted RNA-binding Zn-ribbon protein involved in translation (DUF1610 family)
VAAPPPRIDAFRPRGNQSTFLINHLARHAAVDREIGAGHEAGAPAVERKRDDLDNILRLADAAAGMLSVIDASQRGVIFGFDPARSARTVDTSTYAVKQSHRLALATKGFFGECQTNREGRAMGIDRGTISRAETTFAFSDGNRAVRLAVNLRCPRCGTELKADDISADRYGSVVLVCNACGFNILTVS